MGKKHDSRKAAKRDRRAAKRAGREVDALYGLADIHHFLRTSERPLWFVSPSPFALLGAELRGRLGSPAVAAALVAETGLRPVPSVVGRASGYGVLHALAVSAGLGRDLVVTTPEDETYAVGSEADWHLHAGALGGRELTLRARAQRCAAVLPAVVTGHGTIVAASPAEVTRLAGVTPHGSARVVSRSRLPDEQRAEARRCTQLVGDRLREEGYRGWFELELELELETGAVHFGALGQAVSDAGALANVAAVGDGVPPLVLFHLLEHLGVDYELDVDAVNAVADAAADGGWSVLHLEDDAEDDEPFARAPRSGVWRIDPTAPAGIRFARREIDWRTVTGDDEAFYLRIARAGERRAGADIGVLVARGRFESDGRPTDRALQWGAGIARRLREPPRAARHREPLTTA